MREMLTKASVREHALRAGIAMVFSAWYGYVSGFYVDGDILYYEAFYQAVQVLNLDFSSLFGAGFLEVLRLQLYGLNSTEPLYAFTIILSSYIFSFHEYQLVTIFLLCFLSAHFLRSKVGMDWGLLIGFFCSSYFVVFAIPADRLKIAWIVFMATSLCLEKALGKSIAPMLALLGHIQVGITGLASYVRDSKLSLRSWFLFSLLLVFFVYLVFDQIFVKIVTKEEVEGALFSALLGISILIFIALFSDNKFITVLVLLPFALFGLVFDFSRINLSIWILYILMLDFRKWQVRLWFFLLSAFLFVKSLEMHSKIFEKGFGF